MMSRRMPFLPENKLATAQNYPKLRLDYNERRRILCVEEPVFAYTHVLRAPKIIDGKPVMVKAQRKDKSTYETFDKDFLGRPQCLGDLDSLTQNGLAPDACPVCELAQESDVVSAPERRFAMHIIDYAIKGDGFDIRSPFSVGVEAWAFADGTFNRIVDIATEWASQGGLQKHDLLLGPCENKDFQKFDIRVSATAAWLENEERKSLTVETFKENKFGGDLEEFCGRKVEKAWLLDDLEKIKARWRIANGESPFESPESSELLQPSGLSSGLDDLLSEAANASTNGETTPQQSDSVSIGDILASSASSDASSSAVPAESSETVQGLFSTELASAVVTPPTVNAADAQEAPPVQVASESTEPRGETVKGETVSFDDLLKSFN